MSIFKHMEERLGFYLKLSGDKKSIFFDRYALNADKPFIIRETISETQFRQLIVELTELHEKMEKTPLPWEKHEMDHKNNAA